MNIIDFRSSHLNALANIDNNFGYILGKLTSISTDKCLSYSLPVRTNFASYAIKYLVYNIL